jgi:hypothetical protein
MKFKHFISEMDTAEDIPSAVSNVDTTDINDQLEDLILSPESGFQKIRKVLLLRGLELPSLFDLDPEGGEIVLAIDPGTYLYFVYALKEDDSSYDFYAEVTDDDGLNEIISDTEDEENEE